MSRIEAPAFAPEVFDLTMKGLETGLRVGDIATYGFEACSVDAEVSDVMTDPNLQLFDCIPVFARGRVVGVLERNGRTMSGPAGGAMRHLDDALLVSWDEPLKSFLPLLVETPHRLVVRGASIEGIVTSSDIHKLPVRLLAFALVTHLETAMAALIVGTSDGDDWLDLLSNGRQQKVAKKTKALRNESFDPPLIELTDFCDKRDVLAARGFLDEPDRAEAVADFKSIEDLRNSVAHAASYAQNDDQLARFVTLLGLTEAWIDRLSAHVAEMAPPDLTPGRRRASRAVAGLQ